ncbi:MAG TPA: ATP-binding protein [Pilimelia sp.]|nr:ATP-binding protein [Pilimelia sp.]
MSRNPHVPGGRSPLLLAAVAVLLVTLVAGVAGAAVALRQRESATQQLQRQAAVAATAVTGEVDRYVDTLRTVASAVGGYAPLTRASFAAAAGALPTMRLAGATSIAYLAPVPEGGEAAAQAWWRARGATGLTLTPVGSRPEHMYAVFSLPLDGSTVSRAGVDASQADAPARALEEARRTGAVTISDPYQLIIDRRLPPGQRQMSFTMTAPVYGRSAAGTRQLRGWVVMGVRGGDLIHRSLREAAQDVVDVTLSAAGADRALTPVASLRATAGGDRNLVERRGVTVANQVWQLEVAANGRRLPGGVTAMPTVVTGAGLLVGLLLGGLVWVLATGRARARAQVGQATAALDAKRAQAQDQAALLAAILEGISDGVGVIDTEGRFLLHNAAARRILGMDVDKDGARHWQEHYGLFTADGARPFPTDALPLVRALHGESPDQVEMVVRNAGQPEGAVISVSARPLHGAGPAGAVAVFHDVTARTRAERQLADTVAALREREADLEAFAGMVAHDLMAPLTSMAGHTELVSESLADGADPAELAPTLARVTAAVNRMRRLIDDLLAYATARDGAIAPQPVDLRAVVDAVVSERTAHLRGPRGGDAAPALLPELFVGPLPTVHADPGMIRQVLDNVIGNALKYTRPGQPAHVDISQTDAADGRVTVEVADRGIGIPADQRQEVLQPFHRATGDQQGTGLGLAICKRIVDRHGGAIAVDDNPGGGTRVTLSLPAAARAAAPSPHDAPAPA